MKIQAFVPVYQESDILPHTLGHLREQGCLTHVIDGWSRDGSYEVALRLADSVERFPADGRDSIQNCTAILRRIEDIATTCDAQWLLYTDADEWRRSNRPGETLADAVTRADVAGFNAIDFRVFQFYCTPNSFNPQSAEYWQPCRDPENTFRYYDEADCISRIPNRKLWKNVGRVHLAGGGHDVTFPGMRVYPQRFTMKHFPFRTPAQAKAKIETRLARRCAEEHAKGWGVHYDQYPPGFDFCWDPAKLKFWKDTRSPLP